MPAISASLSYAAMQRSASLRSRTPSFRRPRRPRRRRISRSGRCCAAAPAATSPAPEPSAACRSPASSRRPAGFRRARQRRFPAGPVRLSRCAIRRRKMAAMPRPAVTAASPSTGSTGSASPMPACLTGAAAPMSGASCSSKCWPRCRFSRSSCSALPIYGR